MFFGFEVGREDAVVETMLTKLINLKRNQGFLKYLKNTSWLFLEKVIRMTLGLIVGVWVARYLGPERFGLLSYVQSFIGLFAAVATLGLDQIIVRELLKGESKNINIIYTSFWLKLIGAFILLIMLSIAINFTSNDYYINTLIFIIASGTVFQSFNVIDFYFQSKVLSRYIVYANSFTLLISSGIKILLIFHNASLEAFAWVFFLDSLLLAFGYIYFYITKSSVKSFNIFIFDKNLAISLLKDSWPLILSGVIISIYMKIDQVMIKEMLDNQSVGQYAAALKLSETWYFIPMAITASLFPAIINAKNKSNEIYYNRLQKLYDLMVWLAVIIALPMTFYSNWVIELLYGQDYNAAGTVLMIHIWSAVFVFLGVASSKWFVVENLQIYSLYRTLAGVIINIVLNYFIIPIYGINGAAFATLVSQVIASYLFNSLSSKTRHNFKLQSNALLLPFRKLGVKFGH